jgi:hypothetical protein
MHDLKFWQASATGIQMIDRKVSLMVAQFSPRTMACALAHVVIVIVSGKCSFDRDQLTRAEQGSIRSKSQP